MRQLLIFLYCLPFALSAQLTVNSKVFDHGTIEQFNNDVRQHYFIVNNQDIFAPQDSGYNPHLYEKSTWKPPAASAEVKQCLESFAEDLQ